MSHVDRGKCALLRSLSFATGTCLALVSTPDLANAQSGGCRQALALGLDVSGSVDALEYRLQLDGLAAALDTPAVRAALFSLPNTPVEILVYEWSGTSDQHILIDWTPIRAPEDIAAIKATLSSTERRPASPATALGTALLTGKTALDRRQNCWTRTLDISGDGKSNSGPEPQDVRLSLDKAGISVNALVVGADSPGLGDLRQEEIGELASYFQTNVIVGPDAFVQTALGFEDYARAMARKLEKELQGLEVSDLSLSLIHI